ncbi:N-hydroxyarylamine O-acetyltransferase [Aquimarina sp. EL_43]|uniref:arylamine N-acetyltransferase family protein n=1 Tax=unclassified Aquimarina TaxID=2627091 RepID=UPI0018C9B2C3|nr:MULTISPECIES: arylamine N-acetyltransferase [unclassified Aquimarina]MBG6130020.1 N-hydroxyarylamine O-acetyltransferase [Aquimarina sp. EL_35]MBG6148800.1 N-hydroxyarylamine O-acetyltransferase [Aquimarina sp. EL_32]MBG6168826.1 N-hydroxyarylamine O-acetyltransferase [Aquimarina sp. EL_43]
MDIDLYLERIKYKKDLSVNKKVLFELQQSHLKNVPFENLDIHYDNEITLNVDTIYNKIVVQKRGGFCYELNGLFYHLLKEIGFEVKMISGRVYNTSKGYGKEYDHLAIITSIHNNDYLVDVGFGKFSYTPLLIKPGVKLSDDFGYFEFDKFDDDYLRVNEVVDEVLTPQYIFKTIGRNFNEFQEMCIFHQTSKDSHFTQKKVISRITDTGRITLNDNQCKITQGADTKIIEFTKETKLNELLKEHFDIEIQKPS